MPTKRPLRLVVTPGDPDGIGPEIVWKAHRRRKRHPAVEIIYVGAAKPYARLGARVEEIDPDSLRSDSASFPFSPGRLWLIPAPRSVPRGSGRFLAGYQAGWSIETATRLVLEGLADAIVTGPIHKERLQRGGYIYPGHTEFLADLCASDAKGSAARSVTMMLANEKLRISLATTHVALSDVSRALTREKLERAIVHTIEHLRKWWRIRKPRVAVAALNPHAGEDGLFGSEEKELISPVVNELSRRLGDTCQLTGPHPADTLFARHVSLPKKERYDAVVCMYHDQGLIPVKLLDFPNTINVTLGLPIVRTSVDHGVAFDIAGKGVADASSLEAAIRMAVEISGGRK